MGAAIITPPRLVGVWKKYQANLCSLRDALRELRTGHGDGGDSGEESGGGGSGDESDGSDGGRI